MRHEGPGRAVGICADGVCGLVGTPSAQGSQHGYAALLSSHAPWRRYCPQDRIPAALERWQTRALGALRWASPPRSSRSYLQGRRCRRGLERAPTGSSGRRSAFGPTGPTAKTTVLHAEPILRQPKHLPPAAWQARSPPDPEGAQTQPRPARLCSEEHRGEQGVLRYRRQTTVRS